VAAPPIALLTFFAAVPDRVACRAAICARLAAAIVGAPVFRGHSVRGCAKRSLWCVGARVIQGKSRDYKPNRPIKTVSMQVEGTRKVTQVILLIANE
jgi:hypothetical protein